jgi:hypothetical protein
MKKHDYYSRVKHRDSQFWYFTGILFILMSVLLSGCISEPNRAISEKNNTSSSELGPVPQELTNNQTYKNILDNLGQEGYTPSGGIMTMTISDLRFEQIFKDSEGKNATISAVLRNGTVEEVTVKKEDEVPLGWYIGIILLIILICLCVWAGYRYYTRPKISPEEGPAEVVREPIDVLNDTIRMLTEAEKEFGDGRVKEGYTLAGQALRFFLSHTFGSGAAGTNEEIVSLARKSGMRDFEVQDILNRCTMVEYAKNEGTADEFSEIITSIRKIIESTNP